MTKELVRITPFGGCGLHNPLSEYYRKNGVAGFFSQSGFRSTPFSLSANTNHQLIDFLTGKIEIPQWIQSLAYSDGTFQPSPEQAEHIFTGEIAFVEMSTPTEYEFEGVLLNINRFEEVILTSLDELASERKLITKWKGALRRANEDVRKALAEDIYHFISKDTPERENIAKFVRETSSRMLSVDEMTKSIADLRDRLGIPIAMLLHNFNYMPDGRPVPWPADFKDSSIEVARRLNLPMLDPANYVQKYGVAEALVEDRRHWNPAHFAAVGKMFSDFCAAVLDGTAAKYPGNIDMATASVSAIAPPDPSGTVAAPSAAARAPSAPKESVKALEAAAKPPEYEFDCKTGGQLPVDKTILYAVIVLGGAWANGANSDHDDGAVTTSPEHPTNALMFDVGVRPRGRDATMLVPLREKAGGSAKETPCAGIADQVLRNCEDRFGLKPEMLFFSISRNGTSLSGQGMSAEDGLMRGSAQHREVMRLIGQARKIATGRGNRLQVAAICLLHGESEAGEGVPGSVYRRALSSLQLQYDADIRTLTGQTEPVRLYLSQTNRVTHRIDPDIPVAQLNAKFDNPYVQCVGPTYFAPPESRPTGPPVYATAMGYRRIGQMFGRFLLDDLWGTSRDPLRVEEVRWVGQKTIRVRYNRPIHLEEDDGRVNVTKLGPGVGIDFNDGTKWSPSVESVRPVRGREAEVDVELTAPSTGYSKRLLIAARPTGEGGVGCIQGARSGIRSRDAFDVDPLDGTELFDWACTEVLSLS